MNFISPFLFLITFGYLGCAHAQSAALELPPVAVRTAGNKLEYLTPYIQRTLATNPQLLQAESDNRVADLQWREARAGLIPRVVLSSNLGQDRQNLTTQNQRYIYNQQMTQLRLIWPLYDTSLSGQVRQRQAASTSSDWRLTDLREQLALQTVQTYSELVRNTRLTILAHENLAAHRLYVAQIKAIAKADIGKASDLPSAIGRVALATSVVTSRLVKLEQTRSVWKQLTGLEAPIEVTDLKAVAAPKSLEQVIDMAFVANPVIMLAKAEIDVARQGIPLALAAYAPKVNAEMSYKAGQDYGGIAGNRKDTYAGLAVEWTLFAGGASSLVTREAMEKVLAAEYGFTRIQQELRSRIEGSWHDFVGAEASLEAFREYEANARLTLEANRSQFKLGRRSLLEVLNAENELFTARSNFESALHDISQATWRLLSLRGQLMSEVGL